MVYLEKFTGWNKISENNEEIHSICEKYEIRNYTINDGGVVDVTDRYVNLSREDLTKIPIKFGRVSGDFYCDHNRLSSLEGCPTYVGGDFLCGNNMLKSLVGGPIEVLGVFYCESNGLKTLEGCPKSVGDLFNFNDNGIVTMDHFTEGINSIWCSSNPIQEIYRVFTYSKLFIDSLDWNYMRGNNIIKVRFEEACAEAGVSVPNILRGYKYI